MGGTQAPALRGPGAVAAQPAGGVRGLLSVVFSLFYEPCSPPTPREGSAATAVCFPWELMEKEDRGATKQEAPP